MSMWRLSETFQIPRIVKHLGAYGIEIKLVRSRSRSYLSHGKRGKTRLSHGKDPNANESPDFVGRDMV
jgi:hypothetical protein